MERELARLPSSHGAEAATDGLEQFELDSDDINGAWHGHPWVEPPAHPAS